MGNCPTHSPCLADGVTKLSCPCAVCGRPAIHSYRKAGAADPEGTVASMAAATRERLSEGATKEEEAQTCKAMRVRYHEVGKQQGGTDL